MKLQLQFHKRQSDKISSLIEGMQVKYKTELDDVQSVNPEYTSCLVSGRLLSESLQRQKFLLFMGMELDPHQVKWVAP